MQFKIVDTKETLKYVTKYVTKSENEHRRKNAKKLLDLVSKDMWGAIFAFENEYGERYIVLEDGLGKISWAGDESDWSPASSYYEDNFMHEHISKFLSDEETIQANRAHIKSVKLNVEQRKLR